MAHDTLEKRKLFIQNTLAAIEPYIMSIQSFLIWEKPYLSSAVLILVHVLFWLSSHLTCYQLIALIGAASVCLDLILCHLWARSGQVTQQDDTSTTSTNAAVASLSQISCVVAERWIWVDTKMAALRRLRQRTPAKFSAVGILFFSFTLVVGHCIPGFYLAYITWMCVLLTPGAIYHQVPAKVRVYVDPLLLNVERKLGIERRRSSVRKEEVKTAVSKADTSCEFIPQPATSSSLPACESVNVTSQIVPDDVNDIDEEMASFAQNHDQPFPGDVTTQDDASLASSQLTEKHSSQESLNFDVKHFKDSSPEGESDDDNKRSDELNAPDVPTSAPTTANIESSPLATAVTTDEVPTSSPASDRLQLDALSTDADFHPAHRDIEAEVSLALSSIVDEPQTVAASEDAALESVTTPLRSSLTASGEDEQLDKDFEFLNQDDLADGDSAANVM